MQRLGCQILFIAAGTVTPGKTELAAWFRSNSRQWFAVMKKHCRNCIQSAFVGFVGKAVSEVPRFDPLAKARNNLWRVRAIRRRHGVHSRLCEVKFQGIMWQCNGLSTMPLTSM